MKRHYQLHSTQTRTKVPRIDRAALYHILTDLFAQFTKFPHIQTFYIGRRINLFKNPVCRVFHLYATFEFAKVLKNAIFAKGKPFGNDK